MHIITNRAFTATELLGHIENWQRNQGTLLYYHKFCLHLSQHCPLQIESFDEVECMKNGTSAVGGDGGREQDGKLDINGESGLLLWWWQMLQVSSL
jgi:hypothetical protein